MSEPKFKAGDEVWLVESRREPVRVTVKRVGRTLVYIERYGREMAFRMDSGRENGDRPGAAAYLRTEEDLRERERRSVAEAGVRKHGLRPADYGSFRQSTDVLEALLAVLEGGG